MIAQNLGDRVNAARSEPEDGASLWPGRGCPLMGGWSGNGRCVVGQRSG